MHAVHFGAGNIGRGFVGLLLHQGGYDLVFSDVAGPLVDAVNAAERYTVREAGPGGVDHEVTGFRAINSAEDPDAVIDAIATADIVTTAVGVTVLRFVAPLIAAGIERRSSETPLVVMACENAIRATDQLRDEVASALGDPALLGRARFANTAVDRIVPAPQGGTGIDVTVEPYFEWAIESTPLADVSVHIPGAHFVDDLGPYIERKLFTVNTGHAATAYLGAQRGHERIAEALGDLSVSTAVEATLRETSAVLRAVHGFSDAELAEYRATILDRFRNPELPDTVHRVGRQPMRKLSRNDRFVGPAAMAAERGLSTDALIGAVRAALDFADADDEQAVELQALLGAESAEEVTSRVTGLDNAHPLFAAVRDAVAQRQSALR